ncbi:MAG: hypothetical protein PHQ27_06350 [Victivallales bacterium]|nr:hypothetical protein [Victivallales bacterium]
MAVPAVANGHKDALELLPESPKTNYFNARYYSAIHHYVAHQRSITEIRKWYRDNRDNIVFDPADRKFKGRKDAVSVPKPTT